MKLLSLVLVGFCLLVSSCQTKDILQIRVKGGPDAKIKKMVLLGPVDRVFAEKSLKIISTIDETQVYPYLPLKLYWAEMNQGYLGLTVTFTDIDSTNTHKIVLLNKKEIFQDYNDPIQWITLGTVLSHELNHYFFNTEDPYTSTVTDAVIYRTIQGNKNFFKEYYPLWNSVIK